MTEEELNSYGYQEFGPEGNAAVRELAVEVRRLQGLIKSIENVEIETHGDSVCLFCSHAIFDSGVMPKELRYQRQQHASNCLAFTVDGQVR